MADGERPSTVDVHYQKTSCFREAACDGALGGPTPAGKIWIAFYSERFPLPRVVKHQIVCGDVETVTIDPAGTTVEGKEGIIRNLEFGVYLSIEAAEQLHKWLGDRLSLMKERENPE